MRGKASVIIRTGRLEAARLRHAPTRRPRFAFSAFDDQELEALTALAEKAERSAGEPAWTPEEWAVLRRLEPKLHTASRGEE